MQPEGSLPCSQEPSIGPYPEPDQSSPYHTVLSIFRNLGTTAASKQRAPETSDLFLTYFLYLALFSPFPHFTHILHYPPPSLSPCCSSLLGELAACPNLMTLQRILMFPVPSAHYVSLSGGFAGIHWWKYSCASCGKKLDLNRKGE
jgi:hypothetical protein